jgi:hypothetical protein
MSNETVASVYAQRQKKVDHLCEQMNLVLGPTIREWYEMKIKPKAWLYNECSEANMSPVKRAAFNGDVWHGTFGMWGCCCPGDRLYVERGSPHAVKIVKG